MSYQCLAEFLERLGHAGELARVEAEVDPVLEAAELTRRVSRTAGPALLLPAAAGHALPVLTNLLGTETRICLALGLKDLSEAAAGISELVRPSGPEGWVERLGAAPTRAAFGKLPPRIVKVGACQQVVRLERDVDLNELPALQSHPAESGRAITAALLFTRDTQSGRSSVGRYDLRVLDGNRLGVCWFDHDEPAELWMGYRQRNERMPLAVVLGGDPAGLLAAMAPLPPGGDVLSLAGLLREKAWELVKCRSVDLEVPVDAEMVIEGYVDPAEPPVDVGVLANSGGIYRPPGPRPVMRVTALTHRANPIFPAMVPDSGADEICVINRALQRVFLPLVQLAVPELVDYDLPAFGAARHWASVSIRKTYAGQVRRVAHALWGMPRLMFTKLLVIVDEDVPVGDPSEVLSAISTHVDPGRDLFFHEGPADPLDPAGRADGLSYRLAVDATAKPSQHRGAEQPESTQAMEEIRRLVSDRWVEYGLGSDREAPAN